MIRIGIDGHMLGDHSGGNESYYSNILKNMVIPDACEIYLFVRQGVDCVEYEDKFNIVVFNSKNAFVRNFIELPNLCKKYCLNVLHTQYFIPFFLPCPVVCTIHDICFEHYKNIFTKKEYLRQKILIPYAAKHSKKVFTVSNYSKQDIVHRYRIREEKVAVTYDAVNGDFHQLAKKELDVEGLREKYEITSKEFVLSVCNLQPRKNLVRLIQAFKLMKSTYGGAEQLVIVGKKAWMYNDILKTALEGSKDIVFTDYVSDADLVRLYNAATAFIYPSFFEGFGIPPLEAMACGTPVAVAEATSLPEVVGDAGLYFDPYNIDEMMQAMRKLMIDKELTSILIEKGFAQVHKFSWKESANCIINEYLDVAQKDGGEEHLECS